MSMTDAPSPPPDPTLVRRRVGRCSLAAGRRQPHRRPRPRRTRPGAHHQRHRLPAGRRSPRASPRSASRCRWPCCPTARSCTPPATARCAAPTRPAPPRVIGTLAVYTHDEEGLQGVGGRPGLRHQPARSTSTTRRRCPPRPATRRPPARDWLAPWQGVNRLSRFTLNADFTLNPASKVDVLDVPADRGHVLPRRRRHRLRRGRQPLPVHRRRHQPVRLRRLRADRRADRPQPGVRRAAQRRQHQRPARQDPADQGRTPNGTYTDPGRQPVRRPARPRPGPRSTRWASATRSG